MQAVTIMMVEPRTLHEWMQRHEVTAERLLRMVRTKTGRIISPALFSYILRGSRRCSRINALALWDVTGVPMEELTRWPRFPEEDKPSGRRSKRDALVAQ